MKISVPDSVTGRVLPWLSLMGSGRDVVDGHSLTKTGDRLPVHVTSSFFRRFICHEGCYVCCSVLSLSLDFIPTEKAWSDNPYQEMFEPRDILVNGHSYTVMSNLRKKSSRKEPARQNDPDRLKSLCQFLAPVRDGQPGCSLWPGSPLSCASAYNMRVSELPDHVRITKQGMARAWRYDPAPECEFVEVPIAEADIESNVVLLRRFVEWAEYFNLDESIQRISSIMGAVELARRTETIPAVIIVQ